nr:hypothetical protein [Acidimicrobiia bacterium]
ALDGSGGVVDPSDDGVDGRGNAPTVSVPGPSSAPPSPQPTAANVNANATSPADHDLTR